jgi:carbon monoxide dehydrogenase subunit G
VLERVGAVEAPFEEVFGDGEGAGEGETVGDGEGSVVAVEGVGDSSTVVDVSVAAEVVGVCRLKP